MTRTRCIRQTSKCVRDELIASDATFLLSCQLHGDPEIDKFRLSSDELLEKLIASPILDCSNKNSKSVFALFLNFAPWLRPQPGTFSFSAFVFSNPTSLLTLSEFPIIICNV